MRKGEKFRDDFLCIERSFRKIYEGEGQALGSTSQGELMVCVTAGPVIGCGEQKADV